MDIDIDNYLDNMFKGIDDLITLDDEQRSVILDNSKCCMVVAGAGSGKTTVISAKVKYLVDIKKIKASEILVISFTRKAIQELKERINDQFNLDVHISTFHSFAFDIVRRFDSRYIVNDKVDSLLKKIINNNNLTKMMIKYIKKDRVCKKEFKKANSPLEFFLNFTIENFYLYKMGVNRDFSSFRYCKYYDYLSNILQSYNEYSYNNHLIDFEDMISLACECLDNYDNKYKYIIVDEFQDISFSRFLFIERLVNLFNMNVLVVGDDWQSIYAFAGSDVNLFLDFKNKMNASIYKITNTYRNSQQLIDIAGSFIMKNTNQIVKKLHSVKSLNNPIKIYIYKNNFSDVFEKIINDIISRFGVDKNILLLGRYKNDINKISSNIFLVKGDVVIYKKNKSLKITFLTIHASKGLGYDNVILLNACNCYYGFPNTKEESMIRKGLMPSEDKIFEERRLMYVAMTRTKNIFYIMCPKKNKSIFIDELLKDYKIDYIS